MCTSFVIPGSNIRQTISVLALCVGMNRLFNYNVKLNLANGAIWSTVALGHTDMLEAFHTVVVCSRHKLWWPNAALESESSFRLFIFLLFCNVMLLAFVGELCNRRWMIKARHIWLQESIRSMFVFPMLIISAATTGIFNFHSLPTSGCPTICSTTSGSKPSLVGTDFCGRTACAFSVLALPADRCNSPLLDFLHNIGTWYFVKCSLLAF